jgi:transcriptional regulator with XRE-family HTH domain
MPTNFKSISDAPALGSRIRRARETRGLSLIDIAAEVGVHHSQVSRIERGLFKRPAKNVQKLCKYLNVQPSTPSLKRIPPTLKLLQQRLAQSVAGSPHRAHLIEVFLDALDSESM